MIIMVFILTPLISPIIIFTNYTLDHIYFFKRYGAPFPPPPTKYVFYSITCYNKLYVRRTRFFSDQECGPVTVFKIVVLQNGYNHWHDVF